MYGLTLPSNFLLTSVLCISVFFYCILAIQRLFFHPLRHFPGPPLAAVTSAYKAYFLLFKGGEMLQEVERLHKIYGKQNCFQEVRTIN